MAKQGRETKADLERKVGRLEAENAKLNDQVGRYKEALPFSATDTLEWEPDASTDGQTGKLVFGTGKAAKSRRLETSAAAKQQLLDQITLVIPEPAAEEPEDEEPIEDEEPEEEEEEEEEE